MRLCIDYFKYSVVDLWLAKKNHFISAHNCREMLCHEAEMKGDKVLLSHGEKG